MNYSKLSVREVEVLTLLVQGFTTKQIAVMLQRSPKTMEKHRQTLARKMGVVSVLALARVALREKKVGLDVFFASREGENITREAELSPQSIHLAP